MLNKRFLLKSPIKNTAVIILVIILPLILLLSPILLAVYNQDAYPEGADEIYNYLTSKTSMASNLAEKEQIHMKDVKGLVNTAIILLAFAIILFIALAIYLIAINETRCLGLGLVFGSCLTLLLLILLTIIGYFNFSWLFIKFHEVFFSNNYWLLPANSKLITLFPKQFFYTAAKKLLIEIYIASAVLLALGYLIRHNPARRLPGGA
ncbi:TIGR01906 family membrane protein [archaeon]|nr:TIGR01906 family membrane protein [archaeon]